MNLDQVVTTWRGQHAPGATPHAADVIGRSVQVALDITRRDRRETITALFLFPVFLYFAYRAPASLAKAGAVLVALSCIWVPLWLRKSRSSPPDLARPVVETLRRELERTRTQIRLLRSVGWWYLAPTILGSVLFVAGGSAETVYKALYAVVAAAVAVFLYRANRRIATHDLEPHAAELEQLLAEFET